MHRCPPAATPPRTARRRPGRESARRSRSCRWSAPHEALSSTPWKNPASISLPSATGASLGRRSSFHGRADAGDEVVDELTLPLVIAQRRMHDLLGQREGELADLAAQRHQDLLPLGCEPVL